MATPPSGKGGPEEGTPEYNWLYGRRGDTDGSGDATRAIPSQGSAGASRPDETRVMPVAAREERGRGATSRPGGSDGGPGGGAPPQPPGRSRRPRRFRPRPRLGWFGWILLLIVVFLLAVPFWAWSKITKVDAEPAGQRPGEQPGTTYLLVGSDSRAGLTEEQRKELGTGNVAGQRTDTIMVLHVGSGPNLLMSIPRDSIVEIPGRGTTKINAAYAYGGPKLLVRTVEQNTGIRIDDYVEIGFGGFVGMVDAVGGVEICPKQAMQDKDANLDVEKGCQEADGATALGYARSRKTYSQLGDIDRARAQREVVSAIGSKALSPMTFVNPVRYYQLNMAAAKSFAVGENTSPWALARFAYAMTRVSGDTGLTCGVPIRDLAVNWDQARSQELFGHIIDDDTSGIPKQLCTPSGLPG